MQIEQTQKRLERSGRYEESNEAMNVSVFKILNQNSTTRARQGELSGSKYGYNDLEEVFSPSTYITQRDVTYRLDLLPGCYVIIPSLFEKRMKGKFFLRVYIEGANDTDSNNGSGLLQFKAQGLNKKKNVKVETEENENQSNYAPSKQELINYQSDRDRFDKKSERDEQNYKNYLDEDFDYDEEVQVEEDNGREVEINNLRRQREAERVSYPVDVFGQVTSKACLIM
jgi:hypothetical protein